ncbi:MAG: Serine/threonine protein kinase [uncultured bacterium]|nr:MAG: Serine/threonine protein kinase [uncultured bacterium]
MGFEEGFKEIVHHRSEDELKDEKLLEEILEKIREIALMGEKIGFGMTAEVFTSKNDSSVCYKIVHKEHPVFRNSVHKEADILTKAGKIKNGVVLPEPYYSIVAGEEKLFEVLVMKRLDAVSVEDIIKERSELPEDFDFNDFFNKLEDYFNQLHNNKIFHRDFHWGNVMIENKTGAPCVIDFGMSKEEYLSSENPYKIINSRGAEYFITDDMIRLGEVRNELRRYIFEQRQNRGE